MRLDGIRILDLTRLLPGPYGTQLLSDLGAEVIKIENPEEGDMARFAEPYIDGESAFFNAVNRGKKSLALSLKSETGKEVFYSLVEESDVVFEQFRPGVAEKLGIGYEDVKEHNPDIIYCSLSGYGQTGPYSDRVGHDLNYVGFAGLLDMTRESEEEKPAIPGYPVADMAGGLFASFSIVSALASRELSASENGHRGEYIDISMTDVVMSFSQAVTPYVFAGEDPRPGETPLTGRNPWYDVYETSDESYVTLSVIEPKFWENFCEAIEREDLKEYHMTKEEEKKTDLRQELEEVFASKTRDEWEDKLSDEDVMFGVVNTPKEAVEDSQIESRDIVEDGDKRRPRIGFPALVEESDIGTDAEEAPKLGENTAEILAELGYSNEEINDLERKGVVDRT